MTLNPMNNLHVLSAGLAHNAHEGCLSGPCSSALAAGELKRLFFSSMRSSSNASLSWHPSWSCHCPAKHPGVAVSQLWEVSIHVAAHSGLHLLHAGMLPSVAEDTLSCSVARMETLNHYPCDKAGARSRSCVCGVREEAVFMLMHGLEFPKFNLRVPPSAVSRQGLPHPCSTAACCRARSFPWTYNPKNP